MASLERRGVRLPAIFAIGFVVFNIQYLWLKKDPQFVERATSTAELIQELRKHSPSRVLVVDFPYPQIEIAKAAVLAVPGWDPDSVTEAAVGEKCSTRLVCDGISGRRFMSTNFTSCRSALSRLRRSVGDDCDLHVRSKTQDL